LPAARAWIEANGDVGYETKGGEDMKRGESTERGLYVSEEALRLLLLLLLVGHILFK
jgi:hypothetical protein